jgi:predicted nucleic acid-binding protein
MLVDSSAWIEYLRATGSPVHHRLRVALESDEELTTLGVVLLEVLAGARDEGQAVQLTRLLARARLIGVEEPADYEAAAALYRRCRRAGTTPRKLPDCLIAAVAMRARTSLLALDNDFDAIASQAPLSLAATDT